MHAHTKRFHELLKVIGGLHDKKSLDYGSAQDPLANVQSATEFGIPAWKGALLRLNDKMQRLKAFSTKGTLANEGVVDTFLDMAVYALIGLILYEDWHRTEQVKDVEKLVAIPSPIKQGHFDVDGKFVKTYDEMGRSFMADADPSPFQKRDSVRADTEPAPHGDELYQLFKRGQQ